MPNYNDRIPTYHTNAFLNLNGIPYLLAEYLDRNQFVQIDRSYIKSEIHVDTSEAMRAVLDISIDDIGTRANGDPNVIGNNTQINDLIKIVKSHAAHLQHRLDVIRKGIVVRINYKLENKKNGLVIRSTTEDLRIRNRNYFVDINPRDISDNAIIINFSDSIVSTLSEFTHGTDPMYLRVTSIQLFYECIKRDNSPMRPFNAMMHPEDMFPDTYGDYLEYHKHNQHMHSIGINGACSCNDDLFYDPNVFPPDWKMFNRFYHFDNMGKDVNLHLQEIEDRNNRVYLIPCGTITVNRQFMINPGHRIIFKVSIWKNDLVSVNNTQKIASSLGAQYIMDSYPPISPKPPINPDMEQIMRMLAENQRTDHRQSHQIKLLYQALQKLLKEQAAPEVPTIEGIALRDGSIKISWNTVENADGYNLQCDMGNGFETVYTGEDTSYIHVGLDINTAYSYQVNSFKGDKTSEYSTSIVITSKDPDDPDAGCDCEDIEPITNEQIEDILRQLGLIP